MELQELITRGRMVFLNAPKRLEAFKLVNGRRGTKEITIKTGRSVVSILHDLQKIKNQELIRPKINRKGEIIKKDRYTTYEKNPLIANISISYFSDSGSSKQVLKRTRLKTKQKSRSTFAALVVPHAKEILDICKHGEDQIYEFKASRTDIKKITKKIASLLNTKRGGLLFYGIEDDGTISGADMPRQKFDNKLQNSLKNTIFPSATVTIKNVRVLGYDIIVILIPPWNRKDVYQYDSRIYVRKGTNDFPAHPDEVRTLHEGKYVV